MFRGLLTFRGCYYTRHASVCNFMVGFFTVDLKIFRRAWNPNEIPKKEPSSHKVKAFLLKNWTNQSLSPHFFFTAEIKLRNKVFRSCFQIVHFLLLWFSENQIRICNLGKVESTCYHFFPISEFSFKFIRFLLDL